MPVPVGLGAVFCLVSPVSAERAWRTASVSSIDPTAFRVILLYGQSRAATCDHRSTQRTIIFPLRLNQDAIVIVSVRASRLSRLALASRLSRLGSRLSLGCWQGWGPTQMPNQLETQPHTNGQNAGAGVVGLAHACPALSFCHRITQRALQPQHGVLWLCIVPAASSRTAASFSSRSARRDETWSSVELIVS